MKLSENFTLAEMIHSDTADRLHLDNTPTPDQIDSLRALCVNVLQPLRDYFHAPVTIHVAYRSPAVNKAVGGVSTSQHCKGEAADIHINGVFNDKVYTYIRQCLPFDQVIAENFRHDNPMAGWVHVSFKEGHNRKEALSLVNGHYVPGLQYV